jgi:hypothetical protein
LYPAGSCCLSTLPLCLNVVGFATVRNKPPVLRRASFSRILAATNKSLMPLMLNQCFTSPYVFPFIQLIKSEFAQMITCMPRRSKRCLVQRQISINALPLLPIVWLCACLGHGSCKRRALRKSARYLGFFISMPYLKFVRSLNYFAHPAFKMILRIASTAV